MSDEGRMPPRYGFDVNGYARQMYDGYWTPWHIAKDEITALRAALDQEREKAEQAAYLLTKSRMWHGMGWKWNPLRGEIVEQAHALLSGRGEGRE